MKFVRRKKNSGKILNRILALTMAFLFAFTTMPFSIFAYSENMPGNYPASDKTVVGKNSAASGFADEIRYYSDSDELESVINDIIRFFANGGIDETGEIYFLLGCAYEQLERYEEALSAFLSAEADGYRSSELQRQISVCAYLTGDYSSAFSHGIQAVTLAQNEGTDNETLAQIYRIIGISAFNIERYDEAINNLKTAQSLDPGIEFVNYYSGLAYYSAQDFGSAQSEFEKSINRNEIAELSRYYIALCKINTEKFKEAMDILNSIVEENTEPEVASLSQELLNELDENLTKINVNGEEMYMWKGSSFSTGNESGDNQDDYDDYTEEQSPEVAPSDNSGDVTDTSEDESAAVSDEAEAAEIISKDEAETEVAENDTQDAVSETLSGEEADTPETEAEVPRLMTKMAAAPKLMMATGISDVVGNSIADDNENGVVGAESNENGVDGADISVGNDVEEPASIQKLIEDKLKAITKETEYVVIKLDAVKYEGDIDFSKAYESIPQAVRDDVESTVYWGTFFVYILTNGSYVENQGVVDIASISASAPKAAEIDGDISVSKMNAVLAGITLGDYKRISIGEDADLTIYGSAEEDKISVCGLDDSETVIPKIDDITGILDFRGQLVVETGKGDDELEFDVDLASFIKEASFSCEDGDGDDHIHFTGELGYYDKDTHNVTYNSNYTEISFTNSDEETVKVILPASYAKGMTEDLEGKEEVTITKQEEVPSEIKSFVDYHYTIPEGAKGNLILPENNNLILSNLIVDSKSDVFEIESIVAKNLYIKINGRSITVKGEITGQSVDITAKDNDSNIFNIGSAFDVTVASSVKIEATAVITSIAGDINISAVSVQTKAFLELVKKFESINFFNVKILDTQVIVRGKIDSNGDVNIKASSTGAINVSNEKAIASVIPASVGIETSKTSLEINNATIESKGDITVNAESFTEVYVYATTAKVPVAAAVAVAVNDSNLVLSGNTSLTSSYGDISINATASTKTLADSSQGKSTNDSQGFVSVDVSVQNCQLTIKDELSLNAAGSIDIKSNAPFESKTTSVSARNAKEDEGGDKPTVDDTLSKIGKYIKDYAKEKVLRPLNNKLSRYSFFRFFGIAEIITGKDYSITTEATTNGAVIHPSTFNLFEPYTKEKFENNKYYTKDGDEYKEATKIKPGDDVGTDTIYYVKNDSLKFNVAPDAGYTVDTVTVKYLDTGSTYKTVEVKKIGVSEDGIITYECSQLPQKDIIIVATFKKGANENGAGEAPEIAEDMGIVDYFNSATEGTIDVNEPVQETEQNGKKKISKTQITGTLSTGVNLNTNNIIIATSGKIICGDKLSIDATAPYNSIVKADASKVLSKEGEQKAREAIKPVDETTAERIIVNNPIFVQNSTGETTIRYLSGSSDPVAGKYVFKIDSVSGTFDKNSLEIAYTDNNNAAKTAKAVYNEIDKTYTFSLDGLKLKNESTVIVKLSKKSKDGSSFYVIPNAVKIGETKNGRIAAETVAPDKGTYKFRLAARDGYVFDTDGHPAGKEDVKGAWVEYTKINDNKEETGYFALTVDESGSFMLSLSELIGIKQGSTIVVRACFKTKPANEQTTDAEEVVETDLNNENPSPDDKCATSVGAGISVNVAKSINNIRIENTDIQAGSAEISATPGENTENAVESYAASGNGKASKGIGGAVSVLVAKVTDNVDINGNSKITLNDGGLTVNSSSPMKYSSIADGLANKGGNTLGVGASIAVAVLNTEAQALIEYGTIITSKEENASIDSLTVSAKGMDNTEIKAVAGTAGSISALPSVAVCVTNNTIKACVEDCNHSLKGADIKAENDVKVETESQVKRDIKADAQSSGEKAGMGGSFVIAVQNDSAVSSLDRNVEAKNIYVTSTSSSDINGEAKASANGAFVSEKEKKPSDTGTSDKQINGIWNSIKKILYGQSGNSGRRGSINGDMDYRPTAATTEGSVDVAAAFALNIQTNITKALIGDNHTVKATGENSLPDEDGKITLNGNLNIISKAKNHAVIMANGSASKGKVGVGVAVAINKVNYDNIAEVGTTALEGENINIIADLNKTIEENPEDGESADADNDTVGDDATGGWLQRGISNAVSTIINTISTTIGLDSLIGTDKVKELVDQTTQDMVNDIFRGTGLEQFIENNPIDTFRKNINIVIDAVKEAANVITGYINAYAELLEPEPLKQVGNNIQDGISKLISEKGSEYFIEPIFEKLVEGVKNYLDKDKDERSFKNDVLANVFNSDLVKNAFNKFISGCIGVVNTEMTKALGERYVPIPTDLSKIDPKAEINNAIAKMKELYKTSIEKLVATVTDGIVDVEKLSAFIKSNNGAAIAERIKAAVSKAGKVLTNSMLDVIFGNLNIKADYKTVDLSGHYFDTQSISGGSAYKVAVAGSVALSLITGNTKAIVKGNGDKKVINAGADEIIRAYSKHVENTIASAAEDNKGKADSNKNAGANDPNASGNNDIGKVTLGFLTAGKIDHGTIKLEKIDDNKTKVIFTPASGYTAPATFTLSYVQTANGEKKSEGISFSAITHDAENNSYSFEVETLPLEEGKTSRKIKILSTTYELAENTTAEITASFIGDSSISVTANGKTVGSDDITSDEDNGKYNNIYTIKNNGTKQGVIAIGELDVVENGGSKTYYAPSGERQVVIVKPENGYEIEKLTYSYQENGQTVTKNIEVYDSSIISEIGGKAYLFCMPNGATVINVTFKTSSGSSKDNPKNSYGKSVGVGASFAFTDSNVNVIAEIGENRDINAKSLEVSSKYDLISDTHSAAGIDPLKAVSRGGSPETTEDVAVDASVALNIGGSKVRSAIGNGSTLNITGSSRPIIVVDGSGNQTLSGAALEVSAIQTGTTNTKSSAYAAGSDTAVGASVAINLVSADVNTEVFAGGTVAGKARIAASDSSINNSEAIASALGADIDRTLNKVAKGVQTTQETANKLLNGDYFKGGSKSNNEILSRTIAKLDIGGDVADQEIDATMPLSHIILNYLEVKGESTEEGTKAINEGIDETNIEIADAIKRNSEETEQNREADGDSEIDNKAPLNGVEPTPSQNFRVAAAVGVNVTKQTAIVNINGNISASEIEISSDNNSNFKTLGTGIAMGRGTKSNAIGVAVSVSVDNNTAQVFVKGNLNAVSVDNKFGNISVKSTLTNNMDKYYRSILTAQSLSGAVAGDQGYVTLSGSVTVVKDNTISTVDIKPAQGSGTLEIKGKDIIVSSYQKSRLTARAGAVSLSSGSKAGAGVAFGLVYSNDRVSTSVSDGTTIYGNSISITSTKEKVDKTDYVDPLPVKYFITDTTGLTPEQKAVAEKGLINVDKDKGKDGSYALEFDFTTEKVLNLVNGFNSASSVNYYVDAVAGAITTGSTTAAVAGSIAMIFFNNTNGDSGVNIGKNTAITIVELEKDTNHDVVISAVDNAQARVIAGSLNAAASKVGVGLAFAFIQNKRNVKVIIGDNYSVSTPGSIALISQGLYDYMAISVAASITTSGVATVGGNISVINNVGDVETQAVDITLKAGQNVVIDSSARMNAVDVNASTSDGRTKVAAGGSISVIINKLISAIGISYAEITADRGSVTISSSNTESLIDVLASLSAAVNGIFTGAGSIGVNVSKIQSKVSLGDYTDITAQGDIDIKAGGQSKLIEVLLGAAIGGKVGIGSSIAVNIFRQTIAAKIGNYAELSSIAANVSVRSLGNTDSVIIAVAASVGSGIRITGTIPVYVANNNIETSIGNNTEIYANESVDISSIFGNRLFNFAGGISIGRIGIGATISVAVENNAVNTFLGNTVAISAAAAGSGPNILEQRYKRGRGVNISSSATNRLFLTVASVSGSKALSVGGGISVVVVKNKVRTGSREPAAERTGNYTIESENGDVHISADDDSDIYECAGVAGAGLAIGVGATVAVLVFNKEVTTIVEYSTVTAGNDLYIGNTNKDSIYLLNVGFSATLTVDVAGDVGVLVFKNAIRNELSGSFSSENGNTTIKVDNTTQIVNLGGEFNAGMTASISPVAEVMVVKNAAIVDIKDTKNITKRTTIQAGGSIDISASSEENIAVDAIGGGFGTGFAISGSIAVAVLKYRTEVNIAENTTIRASGDVKIRSNDNYTLKATVISAGIGANSVSAPVVVSVSYSTVKAVVGSNAHISGRNIEISSRSTRDAQAAGAAAGVGGLALTPDVIVMIFGAKMSKDAHDIIYGKGKTNSEGSENGSVANPENNLAYALRYVNSNYLGENEIDELKTEVAGFLSDNGYEAGREDFNSFAQAEKEEDQLAYRFNNDGRLYILDENGIYTAITDEQARNEYKDRKRFYYDSDKEEYVETNATSAIDVNESDYDVRIIEVPGENNNENGVNDYKIENYKGFEDTVSAIVGTSSVLEASDNVQVISETKTNIDEITGSLGAGKTAVQVGVGLAIINTNTNALIDSESSVKSDGDLTVRASSTSDNNERSALIDRFGILGDDPHQGTVRIVIVNCGAGLNSIGIVAGVEVVKGSTNAVMRASATGLTNQGINSINVNAYSDYGTVVNHGTQVGAGKLAVGASGIVTVIKNEVKAAIEGNTVFENVKDSINVSAVNNCNIDIDNAVVSAGLYGGNVGAAIAVNKSKLISGIEGAFSVKNSPNATLNVSHSVGPEESYITSIMHGASASAIGGKAAAAVIVNELQAQSVIRLNNSSDSIIDVKGINVTGNATKTLRSQNNAIVIIGLGLNGTVSVTNNRMSSTVEVSGLGKVKTDSLNIQAFTNSNVTAEGSSLPVQGAAVGALVNVAKNLFVNKATLNLDGLNSDSRLGNISVKAGDENKRCDSFAIAKGVTAGASLITIAANVAVAFNNTTNNAEITGTFNKLNANKVDVGAYGRADAYSVISSVAVNGVGINGEVSYAKVGSKQLATIDTNAEFNVRGAVSVISDMTDNVSREITLTVRVLGEDRVLSDVTENANAFSKVYVFNVSLGELSANPSYANSDATIKAYAKFRGRTGDITVRSNGNSLAKAYTDTHTYSINSIGFVLGKTYSNGEFQAVFAPCGDITCGSLNVSEHYNAVAFSQVEPAQVNGSLTKINCNISKATVGTIVKTGIYGSGTIRATGDITVSTIGTGYAHATYNTPRISANIVNVAVNLTYAKNNVNQKTYIEGVSIGTSNSVTITSEFNKGVEFGAQAVLDSVANVATNVSVDLVGAKPCVASSVYNATIKAGINNCGTINSAGKIEIANDTSSKSKATYAKLGKAVEVGLLTCTVNIMKSVVTGENYIVLDCNSLNAGSMQINNNYEQTSDAINMQSENGVRVGLVDVNVNKATSNLTGKNIIKLIVKSDSTVNGSFTINNIGNTNCKAICDTAKVNVGIIKAAACQAYAENNATQETSLEHRGSFLVAGDFKIESSLSHVGEKAATYAEVGNTNAVNVGVLSGSGSTATTISKTVNKVTVRTDNGSKTFTVGGNAEFKLSTNTGSDAQNLNKIDAGVITTTVIKSVASTGDDTELKIEGTAFDISGGLDIDMRSTTLSNAFTQTPKEFGIASVEVATADATVGGNNGTDIQKLIADIGGKVIAGSVKITMDNGGSAKADVLRQDYGPGVGLVSVKSAKLPTSSWYKTELNIQFDITATTGDIEIGQTGTYKAVSKAEDSRIGLFVSTNSVRGNNTVGAETNINIAGSLSAKKNIKINNTSKVDLDSETKITAGGLFDFSNLYADNDVTRTHIITFAGGANITSQNGNINIFSGSSGDSIKTVVDNQFGGYVNATLDMARLVTVNKSAILFEGSTIISAEDDINFKTLPASEGVEVKANSTSKGVGKEQEDDAIVTGDVISIIAFEGDNVQIRAKNVDFSAEIGKIIFTLNSGTSGGSLGVNTDAISSDNLLFDTCVYYDNGIDIDCTGNIRISSSSDNPDSKITVQSKTDVGGLGAKWSTSRSIIGFNNYVSPKEKIRTSCSNIEIYQNVIDKNKKISVSATGGSRNLLTNDVFYTSNIDSLDKVKRGRSDSIKVTEENAVIENLDFLGISADHVIYVDSSVKTLTIKNVSIRHCFGKHGAAIYIAGADCKLILENVFIFGVYANGYAGAIYVNRNNCQIIGRNNVTISECITKPGYYGGAIYLNGSGGLVQNITFENNYAAYGGAVYINRANCSIDNCKFVSNSSEKDGGAIYVNNSNAQITDCRFQNNHVGNGYDGGAIYMNGAGTGIKNCVFENNNSHDLYLGSSGYAILDSTFNHNRSQSLGNTDGSSFTSRLSAVIRTSFNGVQCLYIAAGYLKENGTLTIKDCTIDANKLGLSNLTMITVDKKNVTLNFENVTFKNFKTSGNGSLINLDGYRADGSTINMTNCIIENCEANYGGAIYMNADYSTLNLNHTVFNGCKSLVHGGAIYLHSKGIHINGRNNSAFNNCAAGDGYQGGAIYIANYENCEINGENGFSFNGNEAQYGGAIYANVHGAKITGCTFSNNNALYDGAKAYGGAVYVNGNNIQIKNCKFYNNTAATNGGAMYMNYGDTEINNCVFENNSKNDLYLASSGYTIIYCTFNHDRSQSLGNTDGSSFARRLKAVINTTFNGDQCLYIAAGYLKEGETLNIRGITLDANTMGQINRSLITVSNRNVTLNFVNVTFKNFKTNGSGSLINLDGNSAAGSTINMTNCIIENCEANSHAGAIYMNANNSTLNLNNTAFYGCKSSRGYGGAIYVNGTGVKIIGTGDSSFNNCATVGNWWGGAICINQANCEISGLRFNNCFAQYGGAIFVDGENAKITDCQFSGNYSSVDGGAIYVYKTNAQINNCSFNNSRARWGGAIIINGDYSQITNSSFQNNSAEYGGAIYITAQNTTVASCSFSNNSASNSGGAMYMNSAYADVKNCTFRDNSNHDLYLGSSGYSIVDSTFNHDRSESLGNTDDSSFPSRLSAVIRTSFNGVQCLYIASGYLKEGETLNIRGITLDANTMGQINQSLISIGNRNITLNFENVTFKNFKIDGYGSIIILDGNKAAKCTINMTNCRIENCEAKENGGAIYMNADDCTLNLNNTVFKECKSQKYGGAIYMRSKGIHINGRNNSAFNNCAAGDGYQGGAIYISNYSNCEINGENGFSFNRNNAQYGGAIYVNADGAKITGCQFNSNSSSKEGGAIYVNGSNVQIDNCSFNNSRAQYGGAILINWNYVRITNCRFENNSSSAKGGAIYVNGNNAQIDDCSFQNNSSSNEGGAICMYNTGNIERCKFTGNSAKDGGALYLNKTNGIHVRDSEFYSNRANRYGGAIYTYRRGNWIERCRFGGDNTAENEKYGNDVYSDCRNTYLIDCKFSRSQRDAIRGNFTITNCQFGGSNGLNDAGPTDVTAQEVAEDEESDASGLATFLSNGNKIIIIVGIAIMLLAVIYAVTRSKRRRK